MANFFDSINNVTISGRLSRDVEKISYTPTTQAAVIRLSLANDKPYRKDVEQEPNWLDIVVWGRGAEAIEQDRRDGILKKGVPVYISGRLETRSYTNKEGMKVKVTEIIADHVKYERPAKGVQNDRYSDAQNNTQPAPQPTQNAAPAPQQTSFVQQGFHPSADDEPF